MRWKRSGFGAGPGFDKALPTIGCKHAPPCCTSDARTAFRFDSPSEPAHTAWASPVAFPSIHALPMLPSFFKQIVAMFPRPRPGQAALWEGVRLPGGLFAQLRCARHIDATARRVTQLRIKITTLSNRLHAGSIPGLVDADRSLRRMLGELKDDL